MSLSTLVLVPLLFALAALLLTARFVLRVVREALREIARDEIKAAIPQLSFGLVRRAVADLPEEERSIVVEWEARLERYEHRPLAMLSAAINIYRERAALATELAEPALAAEGTTRGTPGLTMRLGHLLAAIGVGVGRIRNTPRLWLIVQAFSQLGIVTASAGLSLLVLRLSNLIVPLVVAALGFFGLVVVSILRRRS